MKSFEKLRKLRGRSFDELRVRAMQMLHTKAERYDLSKAARLPNDEELFKLFHVPSNKSKRFSLIQRFVFACAAVSHLNAPAPGTDDDSPSMVKVLCAAERRK